MLPARPNVCPLVPSVMFFGPSGATPCGQMSRLADLVLPSPRRCALLWGVCSGWGQCCWRSEEHTSELQSHSDLVCRLLLEKKKKILERCTTGSYICGAL